MLTLRLSVLIGAVALVAGAQVTDAYGVILIDQQRALVGGIGPGDASGFPVTIANPGSYKLTSNLRVMNLTTIAIEIKADHVTLDLNGFSIMGPNVCPLPAGGQCPIGTAEGVRVSAGPDITVKNGSVTGLGSFGINLTAGGVVHNVTASHNGSTGIVVIDGRISDSYATRNGGPGLLCVAGMATRNLSTFNGAEGLFAPAGCAYSGNVFMSNGAAPVAAGLNLGQNSCNGVICP